MKSLIYATLIPLMLILTACGDDDEKVAPEAPQEETLLAKTAEWNEYKTSLGGDYQLYFKNTGFTPDNETYFIEVRNGELADIEQVTTDETMDDFFQNALEIIQDENCTLTIEYFDDKPVIERYSRVCGSESFGILVTEFHEGHPINF